MALRGVQPDLIQKRLKVLIYGVSGAGKTFASISFPKPYLIDCEKGYEHDHYLKKIKENGGAIFHTTDFDELLAEVKDLGTQKHGYKTLIIDPLTVVYNNLLEKCITNRVSVSNPDGMAHGGHYIAANRAMKLLMNLLINLDMNVIVTSHAKNEYGSNMVVLGSTFDGYKKMDYLFDLVFEITKTAKYRMAIVKKTRIEAFPDGDKFAFSYEEVASRYGKDILERDAEILKASQAQIDDATQLVKQLDIPTQTIDKWFAKAEVSAWQDMPYSSMDKIITHLLNLPAKQGQQL